MVYLQTSNIIVYMKISNYYLLAFKNRDTFWKTYSCYNLHV